MFHLNRSIPLLLYNPCYSHLHCECFHHHIDVHILSHHHKSQYRQKPSVLLIYEFLDETLMRITCNKNLKYTLDNSQSRIDIINLSETYLLHMVKQEYTLHSQEHNWCQNKQDIGWLRFQCTLHMFHGMVDTFLKIKKTQIYSNIFHHHTQNYYRMFGISLSPYKIPSYKCIIDHSILRDPYHTPDINHWSDVR